MVCRRWIIWLWLLVLAEVLDLPLHIMLAVVELVDLEQERH
jgi:hypothetical protein